MFPSSTTIEILKLRVNELSIDLLQEQQLNATLGERIEEQDDLIAELRNKIAALEAIIQEDAKPQEPTRRKLADSETVQTGDVVVKFGSDYYTIRSVSESENWTAALFTQYDGCEVWRPL